MSTGRNAPGDSPAKLEEPAVKEALEGTQEEALPEACLDDVTLPPGGRDRPVCGLSFPEYVAQQGRDMRLDLLRGYFVVAMIVDHVRGPSPIYLLTGGNRFYTSAAEGFILISGLVTGLVYPRLIARDGLGNSLLKLLSRAWALYLLTVGVTLLFLPISEILYLPWAQGVELANPLATVVSVLTMHRTYYLIDVMLLYTIIFILVPLVFVLLDHKRTWVVLGGSWLLWGLFQVFPDYAALPWPIAGNYLFDFSAWQVLFFTGLVLGYHHQRLPILGRRATRLALLLTGLATLALVAVYFVVDPPTSLMPAQIATGSPVFHEVRLWLQDVFFAKVALRPGRLLASAVTFSFLFFLVTSFWPQVRRLLGWLLLPLGQHALYAYTVHIAIVGLVAIALAPFNIAYPGPQWLNALIQIGSVLLIWLLVRRQVLAPTPATQRLWHASPAAIAVAVVLALTWYPAPVHPGLAAPTVEPQSQNRTPRRFGTPIARGSTAATATPQPQGTPVPGTPTPTPEPRPVVQADVLKERLRGYVGELQGTLEEQWFYSPELDRDMPYIVYLPPDYCTAGRRYPVLYMLHGRGGHRDEWPTYGFVDVADQEMRSGDLAPLIIIFPQGNDGFWANHTGDGLRWGEYVVRDLVSHIDATYRTLRAPAARAIGGLSMGGWGALHNAFLHPDVFGVVGAHSTSLRPDDGSLPFLGTGEEFAQKDPVSLARTQPGLGSLRIWMDSAQEDPWLERGILLHQILQDRGIEHVWQIYPGIHEWTYWHEHAVDYLRFYGNALARQ